MALIRFLPPMLEKGMWLAGGDEFLCMNLLPFFSDLSGFSDPR